jgi:hypothetical protein
MGVKKKKSLGMSKNSYRWKRIEEKLIQAGYINSLDDKEWCVWVDCISSGDNIIYNLPQVASSSVDAVFMEGKSFCEQAFAVVSHKDPRLPTLKFDTIESAISASRSRGS